MQRPDFIVPHWLKIIFVWVSILMTGALLTYQVNKRTSYWKRHVLNVMQPNLVVPKVQFNMNLESLFSEELAGPWENSEVVIYHFWATWCAPCRQEIPTLNQLQSQLGSFVKIITIAVDENKEDVLRFFGDRAPRFQVLWDKESKLATQFGVQKYPETFITFGMTNMVRVSGPRDWDSDEALDYLTGLANYE